MLIIAGLLFFPYFYLYADIVITNDDMFLNGKILEKKKDHIVFGNFHGTFTIKKSQIKEIRETRNFMEDVRLFLKKGKRVDENEVKKNYLAGVDKLKAQKKMERNDNKIPPEHIAFIISPYFLFNKGELGEEIPRSTGASLTGDIPLKRFSYSEKLGITGVRFEAGFFHSSKGNKSVKGPRISSGPLWEFPFTIKDTRCMYTISPVLGIGWYEIEGISDRATALKWNIGFITGPVIYFQNTLIFPQFRFDYIHDGRFPLYGIGFGIGLGYLFPM